MDVTIGGVTKSYDFGSGIEVCSDDEDEASLEVLRDAETTEVVLSKGIASATVEVEYTYKVTGTVEVSLKDIEDADDESDVIDQVESNTFDAVMEAVIDEVEGGLSEDNVTIDGVMVNGLFDEDGNDVDE